MCAPPLAHLYGIQSFLRIPVEDFRRMSADILARTYMFSRSVRRSPLFRDIRVYTRRMCTHARGAGARYIRAPGDSTKAIPKSIGIKICDARARAPVCMYAWDLLGENYIAGARAAMCETKPRAAPPSRAKVIARGDDETFLSRSLCLPEYGRFFNYIFVIDL